MVKLKDILDKVLYMASTYSRNAGKELWSKKLISNISSKRIDNIYHIYGKVFEDKTGNFYNCHIKIDFNTKSVSGCTCSCPEFIEFSKHKNNYVCKHIVATTFTFYEIGKKKIVKKVDKPIKPQEKVILNIDINIKEVNKGKDKFYNLQFRIGEKTTYLIPSIEEFLSFRAQKRSLRLNGDFMYNPYIHFFSDKDNELLDYMSNYLKENKSNLESRSNSKEVYILEEHLCEFLNIIQGNKKIKLNHDYINYLSYVKGEKLPISFTLKLQDEMLVLTSKKKLPISLNNKCDVFLYDRNLYLPPKDQVRSYLPIYKELKKNGFIKYSNSLSDLEKLLKSLERITKDIILGEGVQRLVTDILVPHFYLERKNNTIYCIVKINYLGTQVNILDKENEDYIARDKKREELIEIQLEKLRFIKRLNEFVFIGNEDEEFDFLRRGIKILKTIGKVHTNKVFDLISLISEDVIDGIIEEEYGRYYLNFSIDDLTYEELENIYEALKNKKRYYKTKNNKFLDLENESILKLLNVLEMINGDTKFSSQKLEIDENKFLYLEDKIRNNGLSFIKGERVLNRITEKLKSREKEDIKEVDKLNGKLRPYQLIGVNYLKNLSDIGFGGILADEMGLGKTIQAISFLLIEKGKKSIVIAPTSLIYNWKEEFEKFAPSLNVAIIHGSINKREKVFLDYENYDVIITTYGTLKNDIQWYSDKKFDYCIIDEAQNIKSSKAQITKLVKSISADIKIALTGTPMENNLLELWSIFDFIMPGFLGDEKSFKEKFVNSSENELRELKDLINPFILRRLKKDVLNELPEKIEKQYFIQMTTKQSQIYKSYIKEIKKELKLKSKDKITVFSYLTKLRQLCLDPSILIDNYEGGSGKLNIIDDLISSKIEEGNKILIFSQFTSVLKKLKDKLIYSGIEFMYLDGSTHAKERLKLVNEFNNNKDIKVFLISLKAGGTGLNLTSANVVIHFDPWWNPAIEDQATDRAHRIGQKNVVEVIKLIAKDTVEEKIIKLQEDKKEIINEILNGESISSNLISKLSDEEILELFK